MIDETDSGNQVDAAADGVSGVAAGGEGEPAPPYTADEASALAEDVHQGRTAVCPRCAGWVLGTIVAGAKTIRKPVELECDGCGAVGESYGLHDNEGARIDLARGLDLEEARRSGSALSCPLCGAAMRLLRDEHPNGAEMFAYDCFACGASHFEAGGVL